MTRLATADLLGVIYVTLVEDHAKVGRSRAETRALVDKTLQEAENRASTEPSGPRGGTPDPETWGLLPEHQAGLRAAMAMRG